MPQTHVPWSKVAILGMVIQPLIGNPYNGYINPHYWVDDHPLLYGNNGSLDLTRARYDRCETCPGHWWRDHDTQEIVRSNMPPTNRKVKTRTVPYLKRISS